MYFQYQGDQQSFGRPLLLITSALLCINLSLLSAQCPPNSLTFTNQSDLDAFAQNYPDCEHVKGAVIISGYNAVEPITDISALSGLKTISLTLQILHTTELTSLAGLSGVVSADLGLNVSYNKKLTTLDGLGGLREVGSIILKSNTLLEDITALSGIHTASGQLEVEYNEKLTSLEGLHGIKHLAALRIYNTSLVTLEGLDSLESIGNDHITISLNDELISFDGLNRLRSVGGQEFTGRIWWIEFNPKLESIEALSNLTILNLNLFFKNNYKLKSLEGLNNVKDFYGSLRFIGLSNITTLEPVRNWMHKGFELFIWDNWNLDTCAFTSICNYLRGPKFRSIGNNDMFCRTEEIILEQCDMPSAVGVLPVSNIHVYPNPASDFLIISTDPDHEIIRQVSLMNSVGHVELRYNTEAAAILQIDIREIPPGVYLIRLDEKVYGRVVVM